MKTKILAAKKLEKFLMDTKNYITVKKAKARLNK